MKRSTFIKSVLGVSAIVLIHMNTIQAKAEVVVNEDTAIGGMSKLIEEYYNERLSESGISISNVTTPFYIQGERIHVVNEGKSPYEGLAFSNTQDFVKIRSEASTESEVVGKLYRASVATVLGQEGDWTKIKSGSVEGYISSNYLLFNEEAERLAEESCTKYAKATCVTLNVRMGQGTDEKIRTQIAQGEEFEIKAEYDDWVEIILGIDDETSEADTGFVSKDYVDIEYSFKHAVSIEEEQAELAAKQAAIQAEQDRLAALAAEQAARNNANTSNGNTSSSSSNSNSSKGSTSSSNNSTSSSNNNTSSSNNNSSSSNSNKDTLSSKPSSNSSSSSLGQQMADYAVKFVGNPYQWGGTSLTNGADCSGFVIAVYRSFGYNSLPRTSRDQANYGTKVSLNTASLKAGDLLFYGESNGRVSHVALYMGNGKVVHASNYKEGIKISAWNYRTPIVARRILN